MSRSLRHVPVPVGTPEPGNRAGAAAFATGLLGCVLGLIPPTYGPAVLLGIAALSLGIAGRARARRKVAGNGPAAGIGVLLGTAALVLPVLGLAISAAASDAARAPGAAAGRAPAAAPRPPTRVTTALPTAGRATPTPTAERTDPDPRTVGAARPIRIDGRTAYTYADGLRIQVVEVRRTRFSRWSTAGPEAGVAVTVRITNGTPGPADLEFVRVELRAAPAAGQALSVFDNATGIDGFGGHLAAGGTAIARFGFDVPTAAGNVSVEVSPGWYYDASTFLGPVAG